MMLSDHSITPNRRTYYPEVPIVTIRDEKGPPCYELDVEGQHPTKSQGHPEEGTQATSSSLKTRRCRNFFSAFPASASDSQSRGLDLFKSRRVDSTVYGEPNHSQGREEIWSKLRSPFRKTIPHQTPVKHSESDSPVDGKIPSSLIVPVFEAELRKTSGHIPRTNGVRPFPTEESWVSVANHGDSCDSGRSAQTGCTTPGANFDSFSTQAVLPAACPGTCPDSPRISGDLEGRLGNAYHRIQNMPPSPISPTISQFVSDPRTYHKQLGLPQHSVINQPTLKMPSLPNPHATHARSHSQSPPSSFHFETLPAPRTWDNVPGPSNAPQSRHPQEFQKYHLPSSHIDIDVPPNDRRPATTLVHSSQTSPVMIPDPIKPYPAGAGAPSSPQPEDGHITRSELPLQRKAELIKRRSAALSHFSSLSQPSCRITSEGTHATNESKLVRQCLPSVSRVSSSSPSSSYHFASEEANSPSSSNQELNSSKDPRNQSLLPLVIPPSPLRLDIPLHQPWHDRRTNFELSPTRRSYHSGASITLPASSTQKASPSTEALASLAWIGTSPMSTSVSTFSGSSHYTQSTAVPTDEEISISMAMDENISDETVVEHLEIIRKRSSKDKYQPLPVPRATSHGIPLSKQGSSHLFQLGDHLTSHSNSPWRSEEPESVTPLPVMDDAELDIDDAALWSTARKALLCIREIVGTEKKYQGALKMLQTGQTANQPPSLLLTYLPDLIRASEALLKAFLDDPSAWGVSTAFMACEDDIEAAMVSWCSVVGTFFTNSPRHESESAITGGKWRLRKSLLSATNNPLATVVEKSSGRSSPASSSPPPLLTLMSEAGSRIRDRQRVVEHYWKVFDYSGAESHSRSKGEHPTRRQSVRDLAIQPIQRVTRYVLLYRDLLESTPVTSPSRALVERALEAATRIANKCDHAQDNTAFFHA